MAFADADFPTARGTHPQRALEPRHCAAPVAKSCGLHCQEAVIFLRSWSLFPGLREPFLVRDAH